MANPIRVIRKFIEIEGQVGEFIRNGPATGLPGHIRDRYRDRCDQLANVPPWARALGGLSFGAASRICKPYWDDQGRDGPTASPPFTGGQCPTTYTVFVAGLNGSGQAATSNSGFGILGPIVGILRTPTGSPGSVAIGLATASQNITTAFGVTTTDANAASWSITSITRDDNLADSCGNPPSVIQPGPNPPTDPGPLPGPEPTTDPDNPTGPPLFPIPPFLDPIVGPIPIVGPEDPQPAPNPPTGPPPGDIGDPGPPEDTGSGGDAEGEAPDGEILVGLKVDILASPPKARQFAPGVFRGAVYVYMGVTGNLDQDFGGSMLKSGQFFFAEKENLTSWLVSANNGYSFRVTPYYREVQG